MNPLTTLYIDTSKSPRVALVSSGSTSPQQLNALVAGDIIKLALIFTNNGNIDTTVSGDPTVNMSAAIGSYSTGVLTQTTNWYASASYGYTGSLNLATGSLTGSLVGVDSISSFLEVQATDSQQSRRTYLQAPVTIFNQVINP